MFGTVRQNYFLGETFTAQKVMQSLFVVCIKRK